MWAHVYAPQTAADLCVHPKKVQEVRNLLSVEARTEMVHGMRCLQPNVLAFVGPSGCGKESTLRVVCKERGWDIAEWVEPAVEDCEIADVFLKFLRDARSFTRAESLEDAAGKPRPRAVLVKDLPFSLWEFKADFPRKFAEVIERTEQLCAPIVFCVNDSLMALRMFPQATAVKFNAVARTLLTKALERIVRRTGAGKAQIPEVVQTCNGDLRLACNSLQLGAMASEGERLGLFHALGRLLYNKRLLPGTKTPAQLDAKRMAPKSERPPLYFEPEDVVVDSGCEPEQLVDFCFANAPYFFGSLEDLADAQQRLCVRRHHWTAHRRADAVEEATGNGYHVALRGMLDANLHPCKPTERGLFQFRRPLHRQVTRMGEENGYFLRHAFGRRPYQTAAFADLMLQHTSGCYPPLLALLSFDDMKVVQSVNVPNTNAFLDDALPEANHAWRPQRKVDAQEGRPDLPPQIPLTDDIEDFDD